MKKWMAVAFALAGFGVAVLLDGCAVDPQVKYVAATPGTPPPKKIIDTIDLQKSQLAIEFKNAADADKPPKYQLSVVSQPLEDAASRIYVVRADNLLQRTTVVIAKRANTDLVDNIGTEVTDNRKELLTNVGTLLKTVGPLFTSTGAEPPKGLPGFSTVWALDQPVGRFVVPDAGQPVYIYRSDSNLKVRLGPVSTTAIRRNAANVFGKTAKGLYYSTCRPVTVTYTLSSGELSWTGKIADPAYLEYVAFPRKGKIQMQSECGVSVTSEKDPTVTGDALIATAVAQALAVHEAMKKADD